MIDEKDYFNGLPTDVIVEGWVQVRQMLNEAYGEEYVTENPILIAAGIVAEALYNHCDTMMDDNRDIISAIAAVGNDVSHSIDCLE